MHKCISELTIIVSDNGVSPDQCQAIIQCWNIFNWTLGNKLQWNLNQNSYIFIQENALENVVWKMVAILPRPQCVKNIIIKLSMLIDDQIVMSFKTGSSEYCQTSNTRCTKSQNLNVSRLVLQLSLSNPLQPGVKSSMKM